MASSIYMTYATTVAADSPVHYFKLDETTGTSFAQSGSDSFTSTLTKGTGITLNQTGIDGRKAVLLNATSAANAQATALSSTMTRTSTYEIWFKTTTNGVLAQWGSGNNSWTMSVSGGKCVWNWGGGNGYTLTGATTVTNGSWHHMVAMLDNVGGTSKLYVDKVLDASVSGPLIPNLSSNATLYIGNDVGGSINGTVDEFAVYATNLTSTRVNAHYDNAGLGTAITVDVTPALGTGDIYAATVDAKKNIAIDVTAVTASGQSYDPVVVPGVSVAVDATVASGTAQVLGEPTVTFTSTVTASRDYKFNGSTLGDQSETSTSMGFPEKYVMDFEVPAGVNSTGFKHASLTMYFSYVGATPPKTISIAQITSEWATGATTFNTDTTTATTFSVGATGLVTIPLDWIDVGNFYGLLIDGPTNGEFVTFSTAENSNAAQRPKMVFDYAVVPQTVDFTATAASATAFVNEPAAGAGVTTDATIAIANGFANDATAESVITPDVIVTVGQVTAIGQAYAAEASAPVEVSVTSATATGSVNDVTVEVSQGVIVEADTALGFATHYQPASVNDEPIIQSDEEDPYYVSTRRLVNFDDTWYRMNEQSGILAINKVNPGVDGFYDGVTLGLNDGPNGRRHVFLNGNALIKQEVGWSSDENFVNESTLEFTFRTSKKNQFLMAMEDTAYDVRSSQGAAQPLRDIVFVDGKLTIRTWSAQNVPPYSGYVNTQFSTFKDLADGKWHHVVIRRSSGSREEIYVDSVLEVRKPAGALSFPDYIGGRPEVLRSLGTNYGTLPASQWYVGDLSEVVFYNNKLLSDDQIAEQYDNMFGHQPARPEVAKATARSYDAVVKSNKKAVLTLNFAATTQIGNYGGVDFAFGGLAYPGSGQTTGYTTPDTDLIFYQYNIFNPSPGVGYIDERLDESRLIDLTKDLNLDDFEIINVINFPQSGAAMDQIFGQFDHQNLPGGLSGREQLENLVKQIQDAVVSGKRLFLTDPAFAAAIGAINRVEYVPLLEESGPNTNRGLNQNPRYDYRGVLVNPWSDHHKTPSGRFVPRNGPDPESLRDQQAVYYYDTHANTKQRVRALVSGITDIPGAFVQDQIYYMPYQDNEGIQEAYKYAYRPDGLVVGDEFYLMGTRGAGRGENIAGGPPGPFMRMNGTVAAPIANVLGGTVVTSFGAVEYIEKTQRPNQYVDYAVNVVWQPGDTLGGRTIAGRVFMNFTESYQSEYQMMHSARQLLETGVMPETAESLQWEFSSYRGIWGGVAGGIDRGAKKISMDRDGNITLSDAGNENLIGISWSSPYEIERIETPTMTYRGLKWLAQDIVSTGTALVGASAATATATTYEPTVEAHFSTVVEVPVARATGRVNAPQGVEDPNVDILVDIATATGEAYAFREIVDVGVATATATVYEDFDGIFSDADLVTVRLPSSDVILYLEEK